MVSIKNSVSKIRPQKTQGRRADVWISTLENNTLGFESKIVAIIEAKHKKCVLDDKDWKEAREHGKEKAEKQGLNYYIVTNCKDTVRFYNRFTDEEIKLDGNPIRRWQPLDVLKKIQTQVTSTNCEVSHKGKKVHVKYSEADFKNSLRVLNNIFRSCAISKPEDKIDTTISFIILKYIGEREEENRTLDKQVRIWTGYGGMDGNFEADIKSSVADIMDGKYGKEYLDFKNMINFSDRLNKKNFADIYYELDKYRFHGCGFDVYGSVYEEFATNKEKIIFGEFYTPRHITKIVANLLLEKEKNAERI